MGINVTLYEELLKETCQNCYREEMCNHKASKGMNACSSWRGDSDYEKILAKFRMMGMAPMAASGS